MKVTATTLPRRSRSARSLPSWVVSVNSGAGPIFDRRASPFVSWACAGTGRPATASTPRIIASDPIRRLTLSLQLLLQLVEEAPVGDLGDDLLGIRLDHADLVQAQGVIAHGVLDAVVAPAGVVQLLHILKPL